MEAARRESEVTGVNLANVLLDCRHQTGGSEDISF